MSGARKLLCWVYGLIAALALVGTWRQNLAFGAERGLGLADTFAQFWPALLVNRATISITVDLFLFVLAAFFFMVLEARRLEIRFVWLYILFAILIAVSVTFPLFLIARERQLAQREPDAPEPRPTAADKLGLGLLSLGTVALTVWCTLR
jgi:hypothetical protein